MHLSTIGTRSVATAGPDATVTDIARTMHDRSVGSVLIVRGNAPVGIVTDRDLVIRVVLRKGDPDRLKASDVMSSPLTTIAEDDDPLTAATRMRERQVRRLPVVRADGSLVGIICLDDLIHHLSRAHHELSEAIAGFPVPYTAG
jgi:CBS domain-containing protein